MRIVYISDIHGNFAALSSLPAADLLLIGGDFTNFGSAEDFENALSAVSMAFPNFYAVAGNLDPENSDELLTNHGRLLPLDSPLEFNGLKIAGLSGSNLCPRKTPLEWKDEEMSAALSALSYDKLDILVTHAPPLGFSADVIPNGAHVGSRAVAEFAARTKPALHLCGHIHEAAGVFDENGTILVNAGPLGTEGRHALIEWEAGQKPRVQLG